MMKKLILGMIAGSLALTGCANLIDKRDDMLVATLAEVKNQIGQGGIGQFAGSAQGINPRLIVGARVAYEAYAGYEGIAGQVSASSQGTLGPANQLDTQRMAVDSIKTAQDARDTARDLLNKGKGNVNP